MKQLTWRKKAKKLRLIWHVFTVPHTDIAVMSSCVTPACPVVRGEAKIM